MIDIFLLDDHEVVRRGLRTVLESEPDFTVVGESGSAEQAIEEIRRCQPEVAVLDVRLPDGSGIDVCRMIVEEFDGMHPLILTSFDDDEALIEAHRAGAQAFVLKDVRANGLIEAIRQVAEGRQLLDDAVVRLAERRIRNSEDGLVLDLTCQERRILDLLGEGLTNRQIAERMYLSEKTVKNYVSNLLTKLGMERRAEAAALAGRIAERHHH